MRIISQCHQCGCHMAVQLGKDTPVMNLGTVDSKSMISIMGNVRAEGDQKQGIADTKVEATILVASHYVGIDLTTVRSEETGERNV